MQPLLGYRIAQLNKNIPDILSHQEVAFAAKASPNGSGKYVSNDRYIRLAHLQSTIKFYLVRNESVFLYLRIESSLMPSKAVWCDNIN